MKIKELRINNYLGIENIIINPTEKGASIEGDNKKGKSSILNAITQAITNTNPRTKIVRHEGDSAKIYVEMDTGLEISRAYTADGKKKVSIEQNGMRPTTPETYLKQVLGTRAITIDPFALIMKPGKENELAETILSLLPVDVTKENVMEWFSGNVPFIDYKQHGLKVLKDLEGFFYAARTGLNRELEAYKSELAITIKKLPKNYDPAEWEDVKLSDMFEVVQTAIKHNLAIEQAEKIVRTEPTEIQNIAHAYESSRFVITTEQAESKKEIEEQIETLKFQLKTREAELDLIDKNTAKLMKETYGKQHKEIDDVKAGTEKQKEFLETAVEMDVEELRKEAFHTEKMKILIEPAKRVFSLETKIKELKADVGNAKAKIKIAREKPMELLRKMKLPVSNLSIGDTGEVLINDLPIDNQSDSELIELLCDVEIAKTSDIAFVCVDRWESLGEALQKIVQKKFTDAGIQLFYTKVTAGELSVNDIE